MTENNEDPIPEEPTDEPTPTSPEPEASTEKESKPWIRGLWMVILAVLFGLAEAVLVVCAILQYGWYVFGKGPNKNIADLGERIGQWMKLTARYQTGVTEDRPWPWSEAQ